MDEFKYDVFLSHNSKDKPAIEELAERLEDEAELKVFLDVWNLIPGDPWQESLEDALDKSRTVAVFLGPSGIAGWHNEEMRDALDKRVRNKRRRVIPVLLPGTEKLDEVEIPPFLARLTWVDFRKGLDDEESFNRLVAGITGKPPGRRRKKRNSLTVKKNKEVDILGGLRELHTLYNIGYMIPEKCDQSISTLELIRDSVKSKYRDTYPVSGILNSQFEELMDKIRRYQRVCLHTSQHSTQLRATITSDIQQIINDIELFFENS
jgi:hypothetical protein